VRHPVKTDNLFAHFCGRKFSRSCRRRHADAFANSQTDIIQGAGGVYNGLRGADSQQWFVCKAATLFKLLQFFVAQFNSIGGVEFQF
jgi:hypothetical protein